MLRAPAITPTTSSATAAASAGKRRWSSAGLGALAGVLLLLGASSPWWYLTSSSSGTSSIVEFYPGGLLHLVTSGGGGTTSYTQAGAPSVGVLYEVVLGALLGLTLVVAVIAADALRRERGTPGSRTARRAIRLALLGVIVGCAVMAVAVPIAQPALYRGDDPAGACGVAHPPAACGTFWGSTSRSGVASTWGAGAGWWLDVLAIVPLGVTWAIERRRYLRPAS